MTEKLSVGIQDAYDEEHLEDVKRQIRQRSRLNRQQLHEEERLCASQSVCMTLNHVCEHYQRIAAYMAYGHEIDLLAFISDFSQRSPMSQSILLPKLGPNLSRNWAWFTSCENTDFSTPGRPAEPIGPSVGQKAIADVDCVLVPALATDRFGHRIGQGGGWYDRALRYITPDTPVIAICYDEEFYDDHALPHGEHDFPVTMTITPHHIFHSYLSTGPGL